MCKSHIPNSTVVNCIDADADQSSGLVGGRESGNIRIKPIYYYTISCPA